MTKYNIEPVLLFIEDCSADFDRTTLSKETVMDLDGKIECEDGRSNGWGLNFTKEYLPQTLIEWLDKHDFEIDVINPDRNGSKLFYYIRFSNEQEKLEYILKFDSVE